MKRKTLTRAARLLCVLSLALSLTTAVLAADPHEPNQTVPFYPTAVTRSDDGGEIRKMYDLGPEDDPAGIPRSDFEQEGYHYTLIDLLKQKLPANESRQHTETVFVPSQSKDMGAVLALLPQTKEFITEDGLVRGDRRRTDELCGHISNRRHLLRRLRFFKEVCKKLFCVAGWVVQSPLKEVILTAEEDAKAQKALAARNREQEQNKLRMRRVREAQRAAKEAEKVSSPAG